MSLKDKYLKYKIKYLEIKQNGGNIDFTKTYIDNINPGNIERLLNIKILSSTDNISSIDLSNTDIIIRNTFDPLFTNKTDTLIIAGGWGDNFNIIKQALKGYNGNIIYLRDKYNEWYNPLISAYTQFIIDHSITTPNLIFLGWSMGGYAALYLSVLLRTKNCISVTLAPQTINYQNFNDKISTIRVNKIPPVDNNPPYISNIDGIQNITDIFDQNYGNTTKHYIITGKSECGDFTRYGMHLHEDILHASVVIHYPNVRMLIVNRDTHALLGQLNFKDLINYFNNNFDVLFKDQVAGLKLLEKIPYFSSI
jgi:pimeloyl-ACP methyl ester carboxylesterase